MRTYTRALSKKYIPQTEPVDEIQVENNAGGYGYKLDMWKMLDRFLILGSEGGTYYVGEKKLTQDSAKNLTKCIDADGARVLKTIVEISDSGRAPKNDPALFALAACLKTGNEETRKLASDALPKVARIGTHLFHFAEFCEIFGGWGRGTKRTISNWYLNKPLPKLAEQIVKYQSRDGWSHSDLIRLAHIKTDELTRNILFQYAGAKYSIKNPELKLDKEGLEMIVGFEKAKIAKTEKEIAKLISNYNLPRECVPTKFLDKAVVWEALLPGMGLTAMIRNLGNMSKVGILDPLSDNSKKVIKTITDAGLLKKARIHPIAVLLALKTYSEGHGYRGSNTWTVNQDIVDALDSAFYLTFDNVVPTGKNIMLALDVSGSMDGSMIAGTNLTAREAVAAMALVTARVEPNRIFTAFSTRLVDLKISPKWRLDQVIEYMKGFEFGGTDCSLPVFFALQKKLKIDAFCVYTDSETWAGDRHVSEYLKEYRNKFVKDAKMIIVGTTATNISIADPRDVNSLDVVGFDASAPAVISDFIRG